MKKPFFSLLAGTVLSGVVLTLSPVVQPHFAAAARLGAKPPYVIALSNSFIGNAWRAQMENEVKAESMTPQDRSLVKKLIVENAGQDAAAQISQMQGMIAQHVNAILVDAASPTSLNNVIRQANQQGITVVSFDNLVTSPYAIKQNYSNTDWGAAGMNFIAKVLHGKGRVVLIEGEAGAGAEVDRENGVAQVLKTYPHITVAARVNGNWSDSGGHQAMTSVLASGTKFDAIWSSGGMAGGIISALLQVHHPLVPITDAAFNNYLKLLKQYGGKGLTGLAVGDTDYSGALALNTALAALQGHHVSMNIINPIRTYTVANPATKNNPNLPDTFNVDYTSPQLGSQGQLTVQDVLHGSCCYK